MKRNIFSSYIMAAMVSIAAATFFTSCEKDTDGSPDIQAGSMQASAITPGEAPGGAVLTLKGSGLGQIRSIVFEKNNVPASFSPNLNTDNAVLFRVPDTAFGGAQNIIFTNSAGAQVKVPFTVIALPTVTGVSNYNFVENSEIIIYGNNFDDVSKVVFTGTNVEIPVISKSRKEMTLKMPATTIVRSKLDITNASGKITTSDDYEFVNMDKSFVVYTDAFGTGAYNSGVQSWSWGINGPTEVNTIVKTGTKALKVDYITGGLSLFLGSDWAADAKVFTDYMPNRAFLTFWAYAPGEDVTIRIVTDGPPGPGQGEIKKTIAKDKWTYFKIPSGTWTGRYGRMNFVIDGSSNKTVYFDDILWVE